MQVMDGTIQNHRITAGLRLETPLEIIQSKPAISEQRQLQHITQDHVQLGFEYFQEQRIHSLSEKPTPVFEHSHSEKVLSLNGFSCISVLTSQYTSCLKSIQEKKYIYIEEPLNFKHLLRFRSRRELKKLRSCNRVLGFSSAFFIEKNQGIILEVDAIVLQGLEDREQKIKIQCFDFNPCLLSFCIMLSPASSQTRFTGL